MHGGGQGFHQLRSFSDWPGVPINLPGQAAAGTLFQRQVGKPLMRADLEDLNDVRMLEAGRRFRLDLETLSLRWPRMFGVEYHLQGHSTVQGQLASLVNDPKPPLPSNSNTS